MTTANPITTKLVFSFQWSRKIVSVLVFLVGLLITNPTVHTQELEKDFSLAEFLMKLELDRYAESKDEENPSLYELRHFDLRRIKEKYNGHVTYVLSDDTQYNPIFLFVDDTKIFEDYFGDNYIVKISVGSNIGALRYSSNNRAFRWSRISFPDSNTMLTSTGEMQNFHVYSLRYAEKDGVPFGPYPLHIGASRVANVYLRDKEKKLHNLGKTPCTIRLYRSIDAEIVVNRSDIVPLVQKIQIRKPDDLMYFDVGSSNTIKGTLTVRTVSNANIVLEGIIQGKTNAPIKLSHPLPPSLNIQLHSGNVNRYMTIQIPDSKESEVLVDFDIEPRWITLEIPTYIKDFRVHIDGLHNKISDREYVLFGTDIPIKITRPTYNAVEHLMSASPKERVTIPVRFTPDYAYRRSKKAGNTLNFSFAMLPPPNYPYFSESDFIYEFRFGGIRSSVKSGLLIDLSFACNIAVANDIEIMSTYSTASMRGGVGYRVWMGSVACIYTMAYGHFGVNFLWTEVESSSATVYAEPELALGATIQGSRYGLFIEGGLRPILDRLQNASNFLSCSSYIPVVTVGIKRGVFWE